MSHQKTPTRQRAKSPKVNGKASSSVVKRSRSASPKSTNALRQAKSESNSDNNQPGSVSHELARRILYRPNEIQHFSKQLSESSRQLYLNGAIIAAMLIFLLTFSLLTTRPRECDDNSSNSLVVPVTSDMIYRRESRQPNVLSLNGNSNIRLATSSALPPPLESRAVSLSRTTLKYAFDDGDPVLGNCWWLPPPSGSGTATFEFMECITPASLVVHNIGPVDLYPSKISWWSDSDLLGEIIVNGGKQTIAVPRRKKACYKNITIFASGRGSVNGSCTHHIGIVGETHHQPLKVAEPIVDNHSKRIGPFQE